MEKLITVKGIGNINIKPDLIIVNMELVSNKDSYDETMKVATESIDKLSVCLEEVGIDRSELKTTNFDIRRKYESYYDEDNNYKDRFDGYECNQQLRLELDLDMEKLSNIIEAITLSGVDPKFNIRFSVKDKNAVNEEILINATENARRKAEILVKASNEKLGDIVSIDYSFSDIDIYSDTTYQVQEKIGYMEQAYSPSIQPEDIKINDTVTFVWKIK